MENKGQIEMNKGSLEFEWKIPRFFSTHKKYNVWQTPNIEFLGSRWIIVMNFEDNRFMYFFKIQCGPFNFRIDFTIGIKGLDGSLYEYAYGVKEPSSACGTPSGYLRPLDLPREKELITARDDLTVFCSLSVKEENCVTTADFTMQTEIFEGIHASTQVVEKNIDRRDDKVSKGDEASLDIEGTCKLSEDFKGLLLNGAHFDTTIKIGDREFRVHRSILGARSSVFQSMFNHDTTERNTGTIEIEDCNPDVFQDFLVFLYSGKVEEISLENVLSLYILSDKYDVQETKIECLKFMTHNFSIGTFCDVVALALRHNENKLLETATVFFIKNTEQIILTTKWQCFLKQYPSECNELYIKAIQFRDHK